MISEAPGSAGETGGTADEAGVSKPKDDNVVDADFDEVKSDKK